MTHEYVPINQHVEHEEPILPYVEALEGVSGTSTATDIETDANTANMDTSIQDFEIVELPQPTWTVKQSKFLLRRRRYV